METESKNLKKLALITGSTSGIGLGIAHTLANRGCSVILTGFGDKKLIDSLKGEFESKYKCSPDYISADLTKPEDIQQMCEQILKRYPAGVDILVNNAGVQHISPIEDFSEEKWDAMIAVMLSAPYRLIKRLLPSMKKKGWGRIVNIASTFGKVGAPDRCAYVSAKHGMIGLTKRGSAFRVAGAGCRMWQGSRTPAGFRRFLGGTQVSSYTKIGIIILLKCACRTLWYNSIRLKAMQYICSMVVALEGATSGVTCNAVCPGCVDTPMIQQIQRLADSRGLDLEAAKEEYVSSIHPTGKIISIEQVADMVAYLCSDVCSQVTGSSVAVDGGWTAR